MLTTRRQMSPASPITRTNSFIITNALSDSHNKALLCHNLSLYLKKTMKLEQLTIKTAFLLEKASKDKPKPNCRIIKATFI